MQYELGLDHVGHVAENNSQGFDHYNKNYDHFSKQCKYLFNWLMNGNTITVKEAIVRHNINSLPRRVQDLTENAVKISWEWVYHESDPKFKVWKMSDADKMFNQKFVKK